jgi:excisionase family DNA binding protein
MSRAVTIRPMNNEVDETAAPFLSVTELAERLGVSRSTAYNLVRDGAVPVITLRGTLRVPSAALERWL